jgi:hypothetical protein
MLCPLVYCLNIQQIATGVRYKLLQGHGTAVPLPLYFYYFAENQPLMIKFREITDINKNLY